jgi:type I restriction enzyme S subunit
MDSIESGTGKLIKAYKSNEFSSIKNIFTSNDVLYGKLRPYLKKYFKPHFSGLCSSEFWVLSSVKISQDFLYHFVSTEYFNNETNKTCGTKMPRADWKKISKLDIYYPNLNEQHKISCFLDQIDRKIDVFCSKIAILKKYKEGFTKRLTKVLNTNKIALSNICSITTGKIDANAMNPQGKYKFFTCSREDYFIDTYAFDCEALLVSGNGEVGLTKYYNGKFNAYQRTYVLYNLKKNAKFIKLFIDLQINTIIRKETNKGAMPYIRLTTFNKIMIPNIDPSLEYLISIAIDKIDKKIELLQNHARVLNNIKNNLLDSLFI